MSDAEMVEIAMKSRNFGIAEGLRMAAEIVRKHTVKKALLNLTADGYELNDEILDKAKEIAEGKIEVKKENRNE